MLQRYLNNRAFLSRNYSPLSQAGHNWITSVEIWHENEVTRGKQTGHRVKQKKKTFEFWHRNLINIPLLSNDSIVKYAKDNLPVQETLTRGYQFF